MFYDGNRARREQAFRNNGIHDSTLSAPDAGGPGGDISILQRNRKSIARQPCRSAVGFYFYDIAVSQTIKRRACA